MPRPVVFLATLVLVAVGCRSQETYRRLRADAATYLHVRQGTLEATYQIGEWHHHDWDQATGRLVFSDSGVARVVASVQFAGDLSDRSPTWRWAWDNPAIDHQWTTSSRAVRRYGYLHWIPRLIHARWPATEEDAWGMTAVTAFLTHAVGAYRSHTDNGAVFLVLTSVRWATPADTLLHGEDRSRPASP